MRTYFLSLSMVLLLTTSCINLNFRSGNGNVVEESRGVGQFSEIQAGGGVKLYLQQGNRESVIVVTDENLQEYVVTEIHGDRLKVHTDNNSLRPTELKVMVVYRDLSAVKGSAGSRIHNEGVLKAEDLEVSSSAGSYLELHVDCKTLDASASAGAQMKLTGFTEFLNLETSAGASVKAEDLLAEYCEVKGSSGSGAKIFARNSVKADLSSGANVVCYGNPETRDINTSSGGNFSGR